MSNIMEKIHNFLIVGSDNQENTNTVMDDEKKILNHISLLGESEQGQLLNFFDQFKPDFVESSNQSMPSSASTYENPRYNALSGFIEQLFDNRTENAMAPRNDLSNPPETFNNNLPTNSSELDKSFNLNNLFQLSFFVFNESPSLGNLGLNPNELSTDHLSNNMASQDFNTMYKKTVSDMLSTTSYQEKPGNHQNFLTNYGSLQPEKYHPNSFFESNYPDNTGTRAPAFNKYSPSFIKHDLPNSELSNSGPSNWNHNLTQPINSAQISTENTNFNSLQSQLTFDNIFNQYQYPNHSAQSHSYGSTSSYPGSFLSHSFSNENNKSLTPEFLSGKDSKPQNKLSHNYSSVSINPTYNTHAFPFGPLTSNVLNQDIVTSEHQNSTGSLSDLFPSNQNTISTKNPNVANVANLFPIQSTSQNYISNLQSPSFVQSLKLSSTEPQLSGKRTSSTTRNDIKLNPRSIAISKPTADVFSKTVLLKKPPTNDNTDAISEDNLSKKLNHVESERKRRGRIKSYFDELSYFAINGIDGYSHADELDGDDKSVPMTGAPSNSTIFRKSSLAMSKSGPKVSKAAIIKKAYKRILDLKAENAALKSKVNSASTLPIL
ncbi:hypothetical protein BB560_002126 [Smittium megazygosporum]|uniref:BHLH domain-containing protein n=1 Tax=Smittium megazygosporum TaxID=133381 RepID=A0A2T9ZFK1_9FUNG|nr:hypothetical protein BB560_002128 [Smittium megazygosporum]PVV03389.1 hypothetical protein BB560_002126 [Smittium megazygosporum]